MNQKPDWHLGLKFINSKGQKFEIVLTIFGDPKAEISFVHEFANGWKIITQGHSYPQTEVGFFEQDIDEPKLIRHKVEKMNEYLKNKHIEII